MSKIYRRAEKLLYSFPVNLMRMRETVQSLRELRQQSDCHAQRYEQSFSSEGTHSDPVAAYNAKLAHLEEQLVRQYSAICPVMAVRSVIKNSSNERYREMFYIMELFYFEHMTLTDVAIHLQKSVSTLSRRRQELTGLVINEMQTIRDIIH